VSVFTLTVRSKSQSRILVNGLVYLFDSPQAVMVKRGKFFMTYHNYSPHQTSPAAGAPLRAEVLIARINYITRSYALAGSARQEQAARLKRLRRTPTGKDFLRRLIRFQ